MVGWCCWLAATWCWVLLGQVAPRPTRAARHVTLFKLVSALIVLTIGGISLIVLAWLALRAGRRHADRPARRASGAAGPAADDWARKPRTAHAEDAPHEPEGQ